MIFIVLWSLNFILLLKFEISKKIDYLFLVHPIVYIFFKIFLEILEKANNKIRFYREEKKIIREIPTLIDFLKSYMLAGLLLPAATMAVLKQKKWCYPIQYSLTHICNNYAQGKSFKICLTEAILLAKERKTRQYLSILYLSLRLGCSTGENLTQILEKVKDKTNDRLHLDRKLKMTTAQMRLQSMVIILAPIVLALIIYLIFPDYILFFFQTGIGNMLLCLMIALNLLGGYFINRILRIQ